MQQKKPASAMENCWTRPRQAGDRFARSYVGRDLAGFNDLGDITTADLEAFCIMRTDGPRWRRKKQEQCLILPLPWIKPSDWTKSNPVLWSNTQKCLLNIDYPKS